MQHLCILINIADTVFFVEVLMVKQLLLLEMDMATQVQILDKAVCISHSTDTFEKGRHPTIFPPAISKL